MSGHTENSVPHTGVKQATRGQQLVEECLAIDAESHGIVICPVL
jgi:hypothetical protein